MLLEFRKQAVDDKKAFGALLIDLSKAFDSLNHDLLIEKSHVYDHPLGLKLPQDYPSDRKQRSNIGSN